MMYESGRTGCAIGPLSSANCIVRNRLTWLMRSTADRPMLSEKEWSLKTVKPSHLHIEQTCPPTPGQENKKPFHIPVAVSLLSSKGEDINGTTMLHLTKLKQTFTFENIDEKPVLSRSISLFLCDNLLSLTRHASYESLQNLFRKPLPCRSYSFRCMNQGALEGREYDLDIFMIVAVNDFNFGAMENKVCSFAITFWA